MTTEELAAGTTEDLLEDLRFAENMIAQKPLFPFQANAPRYLQRKQEYREYRAELLGELARRGA